MRCTILIAGGLLLSRWRLSRVESNADLPESGTARQYHGSGQQAEPLQMTSGPLPGRLGTHRGPLNVTGQTLFGASQSLSQPYAPWGITSHLPRIRHSPDLPDGSLEMAVDALSCISRPDRHIFCIVSQPQTD